MTYETMDWDAEAVRVARAFGLEGEYKFERNGLHFSLRSIKKPDSLNSSSILWGRRDCVVVVNYWESGRQFRVASEHILMDSEDDVRLTIRYDGALSERGRGWGDLASEVETEQLCRGLFHLGLLTLEVEDKLKFHVSQHQKLEWTTEYESRSNL